MMDIAELLPAGRLMLRLLEGRAWLPRRVETVSIESIDKVRRSVTLDVSMYAVRRYSKEVDFSGLFDPAYFPIPLSLLSKDLFIEFDVRDSSKRALVLATSEQDSALAVGAAIAALERAGYPVHTLAPDVVSRLLYIARHFPSESDRALITHDLEAVDIFRDDYAGPGVPAITSKYQWRLIFDQYFEFAELMAQFSTQFIPTVFLDSPEQTTIVKFAYSEALPEPEIAVEQPSGRGSRLYAISVPGIGIAGREHTRIHVPQGLLIEGVRLNEEKGRLMRGNIESTPSDKRYRVRLAPERAAIYTSGLPVGRYFVSLTLRAARPGFLRQGWLALTASLLMLWVGGVANLFSDHLGRSAKEAVVVLLLVPPTAMIALLAREGELPLVSDVLRYARIFIFLAAVANVVAACLLAVDFNGHSIAWIWIGCGLVVAACLREILRTDSESRQAERSIRSPNNSRRTAIEGESREEGIVMCYWSPVFGDQSGDAGIEDRNVLPED